MSLVVLDEPYLLHSLPGRMRIHLPNRSNVEQQAIEARLRQIPGVRDVRMNPLTSNILIRFVPALADERQIMAAVRGHGRRYGASYQTASTGFAHPVDRAYDAESAGAARSANVRTASRSAGLHTVDLVLQAVGLVADLLMCESPLALVLVGIEVLRFAIALLTQQPALPVNGMASAQPVCTCCPVHGTVLS